MGYVQKQWVYDFGDTKEKVDVFGEDKYTNGVQFGVRIDPQFRYGFGINTGLYYEYYFDTSYCERSPELYGSIIHIYKKETGEEVWKIGVGVAGRRTLESL